MGWEVGLLKRGGYQREFDYFKLSLQWPATYCRRTRHCCSSNACCSRLNCHLYSQFMDFGQSTAMELGLPKRSGRPFDEGDFNILLESH
ncbi:hypothetical protein HAX54_019304 [Datura stramonium]|uniref:Uncharacterized protein n=1 Tax=Datura stramonium TaxID=4076 RepID=A0ABS8UNW6_DATST|nr:hypothetical protein [Datura stramonium]